MIKSAYNRLIESPKWCHATGLSICIPLAAATVYLAIQREKQTTVVQHGLAVIDLTDAIDALTNADSIRNNYSRLYQESQEIEKRVIAISRWLAIKPDDVKTNLAIQEIADDAGVDITSLAPGKPHASARVAVSTVSCQVEGDLNDILDFVQKLSNSPRPVTCSELVLTRVSSPLGTSEGNCSAQLSLRIPYAAPTTISGKLLRTEKS